MSDVGTMMQAKCRVCGRYSKPWDMESLQEPEPGYADGYAEGSWLQTGVVCPECSSSEAAR